MHPPHHMRKGTPDMIRNPMEYMQVRRSQLAVVGASTNGSTATCTGKARKLSLGSAV